MQLLCGDCREVMATLDAESVDAVVTDPPYGLRFMGRRWDYSVPGVDAWRECLRVLKPGGHLLCFAGTRTYHRMVCNIEDAGFEVRDMLAWVYGSGFPKSLDISKAIDKLAGIPMETRGNFQYTAADKAATPGAYRTNEERVKPGCHRQPPATPASRQWSGWGTALKPAHEPVALARKPLKGTVAKNVLAHGTGGLNIDGCRVYANGENPSEQRRAAARKSGRCGMDINSALRKRNGEPPFNKDVSLYCKKRPGEKLGRWPANFIHDGSDEVMDLMPESNRAGGLREIHAVPTGTRRCMGRQTPRTGLDYGDIGSAARFFYCAKANKTERGEGNTHPTVKPVNLMRWLVRLVTPPDGILLDPYMGSGSTGVACAMEGFDFIGIEQNPEWVAIAEQRIGKVAPLFNTERITA